MVRHSHCLQPIHYLFVADDTDNCAAVPQYTTSSGILDDITLNWGQFVLEVLLSFSFHMLSNIGLSHSLWEYMPIL